MREDASYIVFSILRSVFHGKPMCDGDKSQVTEAVLPRVLKLAEKHDIAHLIALGVGNNGLADEVSASRLRQVTFRAVYRYEKLKYELQKACEVLDAAQIPFIPLKGSVLRQYYPEPWMRTSCDIDILVREPDLPTATRILVEQLGYNEQEKGSHDVSLFAKSGFHVELHYDLVEDGLVNTSGQILRDVWNVVSPKKEHTAWREMPDALFYFYHVAHMAKHLHNGGCGIRPFLDLWILDNLPEADKAGREALLRKGELLQFARTASHLSRVWLDCEPADAVTNKLERYILQGGVYGTNENRIAVQQQKKGGRLQYALWKIVIPYDTIKFHYPVLQRHRWLTPVMQVRRWCKLVFCGHAKRTLWELSYNRNISKSQGDEMKCFLREIGL